MRLQTLFPQGQQTSSNAKIFSFLKHFRFRDVLLLKKIKFKFKNLKTKFLQNLKYLSCFLNLGFADYSLTPCPINSTPGQRASRRAPSKNKILKLVKFSLVSFLALSLWLSSCNGGNGNGDSSQSNPTGSLEGKVVVVEGTQTSFLNLGYNLEKKISYQSSQQRTKVCLTYEEIPKHCNYEQYTDEEGNYHFFGVEEGFYTECFDIEDDGFFDECDKSRVKRKKCTFEGKKEIHKKKRKDFNCFVGLNKQNFCPGEVMEISVMCNGNQGTKYSLEGRFVNEKDKNIYEVIPIVSEHEGDFSWSDEFEIPSDWPLTNSPEGADWKFYLVSNFGEVVLEDKDNFNLLSNICSSQPGELNLEVIVENGKEYVNSSNNINASFIPSGEAESLAYCVANQECQPQNFGEYKENVIVSLPAGEGVKYVCGKVRNSFLESPIACDTVILDLTSPNISYSTIEQANLDGENIANDLNVEICIGDDFGVTSAVITLSEGDTILTQQNLELVEDQNCGINTNKGYRAVFTYNNLNSEGPYSLTITARDPAGNESSLSTSKNFDFTGPSVNITSLDHLLANYTCYEDQNKNEEECSGVQGSEYRNNPDEEPSFYMI